MNRIRTGSGAALLFLALTLSGCGGGDDATPPPITNTQTTVTQGVITGFGSVIVNGIEWETDGTEFEIDDNGGGQDDLSIGQVVTIVGTVDDNGHGHAERIEFAGDLQGPISAIDLATGQLTLLGHTVQTDVATVFEGVSGLDGLAPGDVVEVSGLPDANGVIHATFVEKRTTPAGDIRARGVISNFNGGAKTFSLQDLNVDFSGATIEPAGATLADGTFVNVRGTLAAGTLMAAKVEVDELELEGDEDVSLHGIVSDVNSATQFVVNGVTVNVTSATQYEDGTAQSIAVNVPVDVEGTANPDGSITATKVEFDEELEQADNGLRLTGQVSAVDANAGTVTVFGEVMHVSDATRFEDRRSGVEPFDLSDVAVGDWLDIGATGDLQVLRLERVETPDAAELTGQVDSASEADHTITIDGVQVDTSSAQFASGEQSISESAFFAAATPGTRVKARGTFADGVLHATEVEIEGADDSGGGGDD